MEPTTAPTDSPLEREATALQAELVAAIARADLDQVAGITDEFEECWSFAAAYLDRVALGHVIELLLRTLDSAPALIDVEYTPATLQDWAQRWQGLAEVGARILRADESGAAMDTRAELSQFKHADEAISLLARQGISNLGVIARGLDMDKQNCCNHLGRLVERGLIRRVGRGLYRLTAHGSAVAEILKRESSKEPEPAPQPARVREPRAEEGEKFGFLKEKLKKVISRFTAGQKIQHLARGPAYQPS